MSIFERVYDDLNNSRQNRLEGKVNAIPFHMMPKLAGVIPGVQKKRMVICTAGPKCGKSQLAQFLYLIQPIEYIINNPNKGAKLKIFYFSLEVSKEAIITQLISYKIYKDTGKSIAPERLRSVFEDYVLDEEILQLINKYQDYFKKIEEIVTFNDSTRNSYGIYRCVREYALNHGKIHYKTVIIGGEEVKVEDYYEPNDPEEYVIVITDHLGLLSPEKGDDLRTSIHKFSSNYCLHLRDRFGYTVVNVQQQVAEQEKEEFTFSGNSIIQKLKPSLSGLADCKTTARDVDLVIGLFNPSKFGIQKYNQVDITKWKDNYRELSIIINRHGISNATLNLAFNGAVCNFEEITDSPDEFLTTFKK